MVERGCCIFGLEVEASEAESGRHLWAESVVGVGGRQRGACARPTGGGAPGLNTYATSDEGLDMTIAWYLGHESWMDSVTTGEYIEFARRLYGG